MHLALLRASIRTGYKEGISRIDESIEGSKQQWWNQNRNGYNTVECSCIKQWGIPDLFIVLMVDSRFLYQ